jgi:hypothetical protein
VPRVSSFELPISASHIHLLRVLPLVGCQSKTPTGTSSGGDVDAKELGEQRASARERGSRWKAKSRTSARRAVLKGARLTLHLRRWACRVSDTLAHTCAHPGETTTDSRDASVPTGCGLAESARSHDGAVTSVTSTEMPAPIIAPTSPRWP